MTYSVGNKFSRRAAGRLLVLAGFSVVAACSSGSSNDVEPQGVTDSPFFDDFSADTTQFRIQPGLSDESRGSINFDNGSAVVTVSSDVAGSERIRFRLPSVTDTRYAVLSLEEGTVAPDVTDADAKARGRISSHLYNDTGSDSCIGNIDIGISSRLRGSTGQFGFHPSAWRSNTEDCSEGEDYPLFDGESFVTLPDIAPEIGTSNRLEMQLDRENSALIISIDGTQFSYPITTPIFDPFGDFFVVETRGEDGATAVVKVDAIGTADGAVDIPEDAESLDRYGLSSQPVAIANGELQLQATSTGGRVDNRFSIKISEQRYIKAQVRLSSESVIGTGGSVTARVGGSLYYAAEVPPNDGGTGQVFAVSQIVAKEDGTQVAEYCAWQALTSDFSDELFVLEGAGDNGCISFSVAPELDENYTLGVWFDAANQQIVFSMDDEVVRHDVSTPVSSDDNLFDMRLQSRADGEGSTVVSYYDDLRMDPSVD
jgi:hypothetical protein